MSADSRNRLTDQFGRTIDNLRVSVTDRCNFRCRYCMPEDGMIWLKKGELMTFEEVARLVNVFAELGIDKLRLTGGEPLMRKELHVLVRMVSGIDGIGDIALTTNGFFLADQAHDLFRAGLKRVNVSLDSLDPLKFSEMARRDFSAEVLRGIEAAEREGLHPIKLNVVLVRGVNDGEVEAFVRIARDRGYIVRFIEFMPLGADDGWVPEKVVPTKEILKHINSNGHRLIPVEELHKASGAVMVDDPQAGREPAERYVFEDGAGEIGFISSITEPFCESCNRIRITSDGKLRTCLFSHTETDLKSLMRDGASDSELENVIFGAVWQKEEGHLVNRPGFVRPQRTMSQIGG
jgi:cyclic pyranopterin phosphate synthase